MPDIWRPRSSIAGLILPGRSSQDSGLLPALAWAVVLFWLVAGLFMTTVPLSGDEIHYAMAAKAIGAFLRADMTLDAMLATVVGYGWFVPGMSLLLTPLYLFGTPDGPIIRIYVLVIMFLLWLSTLREVHAEFGRRYAVALLVFPGLDITWHLFATTAWGETGAGLLLAIVFVRTCSIARQAIAGEPIAVKDVAALELALILAFYLRGSLLVVALAVHIFILSMFIFSAQRRSISRKIAMIVGGGLCFGIAVAPWSIAASRTSVIWSSPLRRPFSRSESPLVTSMKSASGPAQGWSQAETSGSRQPNSRAPTRPLTASAKSRRSGACRPMRHAISQRSSICGAFSRISPAWLCRPPSSPATGFSRPVGSALNAGPTSCLGMLPWHGPVRSTSLACWPFSSPISSSSEGIGKRRFRACRSRC